jgi:hypothetical protein
MIVLTPRISKMGWAIKITVAAPTDKSATEAFAPT